MTNLAITGAGGWLGLNLLHQIQGETDGARRVSCLVFSEHEAQAVRMAHPDFELQTGDVRDRTTALKIAESARDSVLLHTIGVIHPRKVKEFQEVNVEGTRNVLEAAALAGVRRVVLMSSNSPCGCNPHRDHLFDEESPFHPYMNYGRSKMQMEQMAREIQAQGKLEIVIIRAPWFYGPFQPARQTLFFRMVRDGKAPIVGDGENLRSMAYTPDLARGMLLAARKEGAAGQTYWIADATPYSMNQVIDTIERLLETEFDQKCAHRRLRLPGLASEIAYLADGLLQSVGLYQQKIHVLSEMNKTIACSIEKARRELGYEPEAGLEEGMRRSIRWVLENQGPL